MQVYLAVTPQQLREASRFTRHFVHMAYRIGPESALLRQNLLVQTKGGLLGLSDHDAPTVEEPEKLAAAAVRECSRRNYGGAVLDFEAPQPRGDLLLLAGTMGKLFQKNRLTLYVPEPYASAAPTAIVPVCTALSGGNLTQRLRDAASARSTGRLALDLERLMMDFPLPCPSGEGRPLRREELAELMEREQPSVFFSPDLCARYFTYACRGETHFILFDDGDTLLQKLRIGQNLGAQAAFFQYPEVSDLLGKLFGK
ncbi:hypothetical protein [Oscillibacter sp. GMB15532]|uniref:hypothetical protein n=1 Tax=Oscillibacter sp. GMB15532 TaxID=3230022 RepID=UPI0034E03FA7